MSILSRYPRPHPQTAGRVIDGEAVLILSESSQVNVLNPVGSRIFELADGRHSVADIVAAVVAEYEVPAETAERHVTDFLEGLVQEQVLVLDEAGEAEL
ncbi:MAG: PqqD family protein [Candidatus Promineifilaceae bacterium]